MIWVERAAVKCNCNSLQNAGKLKRIVPREYPVDEDSGLQVSSFVHPGKPALGLGRRQARRGRACGKQKGCSVFLDTAI